MTTSHLEKYERSPNIDPTRGSLTRRRSRKLIINSNNNLNKSYHHHQLNNNTNGYRQVRGFGDQLPGCRGNSFNGDFNFPNVPGARPYYSQRSRPGYYHSYPNLTGLEVTVMTPDFFSRVRLPYHEVIQTLNLLFQSGNQDDQQTGANLVNH